MHQQRRARPAQHLPGLRPAPPGPYGFGYFFALDSVLFAAYRYHAVFTNSPFTLVQAESQHRGHAIVEQVFADLIDGSWAHLPSSAFNANAAWVQLAVTAHALTRTLGILASTRHAVARGATIRAELSRPSSMPAYSPTPPPARPSSA